MFRCVVCSSKYIESPTFSFTDIESRSTVEKEQRGASFNVRACLQSRGTVRSRDPDFTDLLMELQHTRTNWCGLWSLLTLVAKQYK